MRNLTNVAPITGLFLMLLLLSETAYAVKDTNGASMTSRPSPHPYSATTIINRPAHMNNPTIIYHAPTVVKSPAIHIQNKQTHINTRMAQPIHPSNTVKSHVMTQPKQIVQPNKAKHIQPVKASTPAFFTRSNQKTTTQTGKVNRNRFTNTQTVVSKPSLNKVNTGPHRGAMVNAINKPIAHTNATSHSVQGQNNQWQNNKWQNNKWNNHNAWKRHHANNIFAAAIIGATTFFPFYNAYAPYFYYPYYYPYYSYYYPYYNGYYNNAYSDNSYYRHNDEAATSYISTTNNYYAVPADTIYSNDTMNANYGSDAAKPTETWVFSSGGDVPENATINQDDNGNITYHCRATYNNTVYYGTLYPDDGCYVQDGNVALRFDDYEVLLNS